LTSPFDGIVSHAFLTFQALTDDEVAALFDGAPGSSGLAISPLMVGHGDFDKQDPLFRYYPLQGITDLNDAQGLNTLTIDGTGAETAVLKTVTSAPTPWQVDLAVAQLRLEERQ